MNVLFQIALGLCPAIIIFLVLTIISVKKKSKDSVANIFMLSAFGASAIALLASGLVLSSTSGGLSSAKEDDVNLELIYAVANEKNYQLASEMIDSMRANSADSSKLAECSALIYAAKGDAVTAKAMFKKANMLKPVDDYEKIIALCDNAIEESKTASENDKLERREALMDFAADKIKTVAKKSKVEDVGEILIEAEAIYDNFLMNDNLDSSIASDLVRKIESACEENPELEQVEEIRLCKVKLLALTNKFTKIAQSINGDSCFDELAIAAELYINGLIKNSSFSEEYGKDYVEIAAAVGNQLEKVRDQIPEDETKKLENLDFLVESLSTADRKPAISRLKAELTANANDEKSTDRPKAYMQLARLEYAAGNDEEAERNISNALNTVGVSDDENFYTPMIGIVDSITDKDDIQKVKDIARYAEDVINNSSDYIVVKAIDQLVASGEYNDGDGNDYNENSGDESKDDDKERSPFEVFFADAASQKRNAFSITSVDATNFETVKLVVNVDPSISITEKELKNLIALKDCNVNIEDFTVEKVEYSGANILLCCDTSGSMGGQPIADLRTAVQKFAESSSDIENIALVTFESRVDQIYPFGTSKDSIISAASGLSSGGGTNMYGAILESIQTFHPATDELNFILLMSDGADGVSPSMDDINNNIGSVCKEKGIVLFSLGLGDGVNAEYMHTLASSTGGYFVYINDSATLDEFYTNLRSQILNRYIITFTAKDTLRASRNVTISLKDSINNNIVSDTKQYYMNGTDSDAPQDEDGNDIVELEGLSISGLDTRRVFKNNNAATVNLLGTKFTKEMTFDVKLDGKLDYNNIASEFVNETTVKLTLPGGMACGIYDLKVTVDGKTAILTDELTVSAKGTEKTTTFGNYVFTSDTRVESDNGVLLSGYVTMNGWLHFNGDVMITGDLTGYSVQVTDTAGSYIKYYTDSATGLAKVFATKNIVVPFAPLSTFNIYNDPYSDGESASHKVDKIPIPFIYLSNVVEYSMPSLELYPNKIVARSDGFSTKFPMQDKLMKAASLEDLFSFNLDADVTFTNTQVGMTLDISNKLSDEQNNTYTNRVPANFGMLPIYTTPASFDIKIDTITNEYVIDFSVKVAFIDSDGIGLKLEWGKRDGDTGAQFLAPKAVEFKSDFAIKSTIGTVPVTYRDFKVGVEDIDPNTSIWNWKLTGGFDLETTKLSAYVPALKEYIGDPSLLKLNDIKASLSLGQCYFSVETEAQFLEAITLGRLQIEAGKITYTCELLDMYSQASTGMKAALTEGIIWKTDNVNINISGTGIINLHSRFFGIEAQGICNLEVSWWVFEKQFYQEGRAVLGFMNNGEKSAFVIKSRETTSKGTQDVYLYINSDGLDCGVKKL